MTNSLERKMKVPFEAIVQEYVADLRLRNLSPRTIQLYDYHLRHFRAYVTELQGADVQVRLSTISADTAKAYITSRLNQSVKYASHPMKRSVEAGLSKYTIHQMVRTLSTFGQWLARNGYPNPFGHLQKPKLPKTLIEILTQEEIERLFTAFNPDTAFGARWQAMLAFFLDAGVRVGELATVKLADVDLPKFRAKVRGKGDKERYVVYGNRAARLLSRYLNLFRPPGAAETAFVGLDGEALTINGVENIVKRARLKSGVSRAYCHLFRHTFATNFLLSGGNAFELQALLGHESLEMTQRYVHLATQLARSSPLADAHRISPLDELSRKGLRFDRPKARGSRPSGVVHQSPSH